MALLITGTKGALNVQNAYLVLTYVTIQKESIPENAQATRISAIGSIYKDLQTRTDDFQTPSATVSFSFVPTTEDYPVPLAYDYIKSNGLTGWTLDSTTDA